MNYFLVSTETGRIENRIVIETLDDYAAPDGFTIHEDNGQQLTEIYGQVGTVLRPVIDPKLAASAEIKRLETESMIPRVTREFMLDMAEQAALSKGYTLEQLTAANAGYRKLKALDDQIKALRAQL
jgi:hypothetical protein